MGGTSYLQVRAFQVGALLALLGCLPLHAGYALDELETEEDISDLLPQHYAAGTNQNNPSQRPWALLPQVGYGPATGPMAGVKFTHRNVHDSGTTVDIDASYALKKQQGLSVAIADPHLLADRVLVALRAGYRYDPQRQFFGLGNNEQGPEPASTHAFQDLFGYLTVGWRPLERLALNFTFGLRRVDIRHGDHLDACGSLRPCPFTQEAFPNMPGIAGGMASRLALSLVWNGRDDVVRPTRGWRIILKAVHTNKSLLSDFEFTRYVADVGYLRAFADGRYIIGLRVDGEWIEAPTGSVPFWELTELGGEDTMRGFFPHRFLGKGRALLNLEGRFLVTEFDFFDLWHIKIDGVLFGDGGRVFIDPSEVHDEFKLNRNIFGRVASDFQYSYGAGLRISLAEALVARIDAGFSEEATGLIYLSFGQTF